MKLIRGLQHIPPFPQGSAITIGNFDGMHLGHIKVFEMLKSQAKALAIPSVIILFEPQPLEFLRPDVAPSRLMTLQDKIRFLMQTGIDYCICLSFSQQLATMPATAFLQNILVEKLQVKYLLVGDDFHFGFQRQGNFVLLQTKALTYGYQLEQCPTAIIAGERVSSTRIRQALQVANFTEAEQLLGRPYGLSGRVKHGDKRGRQIGIPTANIVIPTTMTALAGVYAVSIQLPDGRPAKGVANLGCRPTVDGQRRFLEVHIFDFNQDLYGQRLRITFHSKLRDEQRFNSLDALIAQIWQDIKTAREFFGLHHD